MGINYYFDPSPKEEAKCNGLCHLRICTDCEDLEDRWIHIGKSSCGWFFVVHTYPTELIKRVGKIFTWEDWKSLLQSHKGQLYDEYRTKVTFEQLRTKVEDRGSKDIMNIADLDPFTLRQFASKELIYDKKTNLMHPTAVKQDYEYACDFVGLGPWVCQSGRDFS